MEWSDPQAKAVTEFARKQAQKVIKAVEGQFPEDKAFIFGTHQVAGELLVGLAKMFRRNGNDEVAKHFLDEVFNYLVEESFKDKEEKPNGRIVS
jgi:hypothetical protein